MTPNLNARLDSAIRAARLEVDGYWLHNRSSIGKPTVERDALLRALAHEGLALVDARPSLASKAELIDGCA